MGNKRPTGHLTAVVITWNRPDYVARSLKHLAAQRLPLEQVIVVDASADTMTRQHCSAYDFVTYVHFPPGAGHMTRSRNEALLHASGDIIAFLDDDAFPEPGWHEALLKAFEDEAISAAAGRTCNGQPGEEQADASGIGRLTADGELTGNFAAEHEGLLDVDHGIGANMIFRRSVLCRLGGFREDFPGTALREDSDMFLRIKADGGRAVFVPDAIARHVAAPHVKGRRFDWRYQFWGRHNHVRLLSRNYGLTSSLLRRWMLRSLAQDRNLWQTTKAPLRLGLAIVAIGSGLVWAAVHGHFRPSSPIEDGPRAVMVRQALQ